MMLIRILIVTIVACCVRFELRAAERAPVPPDADQQANLKPILARYESVFAGTDASNKKLLAEKLFQQARASEDQPTLMYVLLRQAQRAAVGAGDVDLTVATVEYLGAWFDIRTDDEKIAVLEELLGRSDSPESRATIASISLSAARRLFETGDYAATAKFLDVAKQSASDKAGDLTAIADLQKRTAAELALSQKIDPFRRSLETNADDPRANYVVGRYECFYLGNWTTGLAKLAKCESAGLQQLADATLNTTANSASLYDLAERWWTTSELLKGREQHGAQAFAAALYRASLPDLEEDRRQPAKQRIREYIEAAGRAPPPLPFALQLKSGRTIDLVAFIDPATDARQGEWSKYGGKLTCTAAKFDSRIYIPYRPPAEYDLTVQFSQPKLNNPILVFASKADHAFACIAGGSEGRMALTVETSPGAENPTARRVQFKPDMEYRIELRVRDQGITMTINGLEVASHKTDYNDMKLGVFALEDNPPLALGCDDVTVFQKIELVEISGRGRQTRPAETSS